MIKSGVCLSFLLAFAAAMPAAHAQTVSTAVTLEPAQPFMRVYSDTSPPIGFVEFCQRLPAECRAVPHITTRVELTPERLSEIDRVNRSVNAAIKPATDKELYGVEEYWTFPGENMRGDCEDYVLLKRKLLISMGWPQSALLITVVRDERKDGHAVLTVRTAQGDYILDNKVEKVLPWSKTPYEYVMRQSYMNPNRWMSLEPAEDAGNSTVAGVRSSGN
jgi:predicted transglutaminase-like cysteine proteinase